MTRRADRPREHDDSERVRPRPRAQISPGSRALRTAERCASTPDERAGQKRCIEISLTVARSFPVDAFISQAFAPRVVALDSVEHPPALDQGLSHRPGSASANTWATVRLAGCSEGLVHPVWRRRSKRRRSGRAPGRSERPHVRGGEDNPIVVGICPPLTLFPIDVGSEDRSTCLDELGNHPVADERRRAGDDSEDATTLICSDRRRRASTLKRIDHSATSR